MPPSRVLVDVRGGGALGDFDRLLAMTERDDVNQRARAPRRLFAAVVLAAVHVESTDI